jgi:anti-sigma factor RsiW
VILAFRRPCADHRTALLDFVDRDERGPDTARALAHLDRCRACERDLAEVALAIAALRRLGREVSAAEPSPDAWLRLVGRITRPVDPWRWRATIGGMVTSTLLVAVLVAPVTLGLPGELSNLPEPVPLAELQREAAYLHSIYLTELSDPAVPHTAASIPDPYAPEFGLAPHAARKEVPSAKPAVRPVKPI